MPQGDDAGDRRDSDGTDECAAHDAGLTEVSVDERGTPEVGLPDKTARSGLAVVAEAELRRQPDALPACHVAQQSGVVAREVGIVVQRIEAPDRLDEQVALHQQATGSLREVVELFRAERHQPWMCGVAAPTHLDQPGPERGERVVPGLDVHVAAPDHTIGLLGHVLPQPVERVRFDDDAAVEQEHPWLSRHGEPGAARREPACVGLMQHADPSSLRQVVENSRSRVRAAVVDDDDVDRQPCLVCGHQESVDSGPHPLLLVEDGDDDAESVERIGVRVLTGMGLGVHAGSLSWGARPLALRAVDGRAGGSTRTGPVTPARRGRAPWQQPGILTAR